MLACFARSVPKVTPLKIPDPPVIRVGVLNLFLYKKTLSIDTKLHYMASCAAQMRPVATDVVHVCYAHIGEPCIPAKTDFMDNKENK